MKREDLEELHFITSVRNVTSVVKYGILSYSRAGRIEHTSLAKADVQDRRAKVRVENGRPLHDYANLYICGRNPTLYLMIRNAGGHQHLAVVTVSTAVLDLPDVVITDQNAASDWCRFSSSPQGLRIVDRDAVFAEYWTHPDDRIAEWRHKSVKCAEVLVPDQVGRQYLTGLKVSSSQTAANLASDGCDLPISVDTHLFFR